MLTRTARRHAGLILGLLGLFVATMATAEPIDTAADESRYLCWSVEDALADLRAQGVKVLSSSDLVSPDLQITTPPVGEDTAELLESILEPFGLAAQHSDGDLFLVVRREGARREGEPRARRSSESPGESVLARWSDLDDPPFTWRFPNTEPTQSIDVPSSAERLVIQVTADQFDDWAQTAFVLKNRIVSARSRAEGARVALEGRPETLDRLVREGLAPYVDAVVYRDEPFVLAADPTARRWWRVSGSEPHQVLSRLLEASARGDEAVLFDDLRLAPQHRDLLRHVLASGGADLHSPPRVFGIESERVRFFLHPETGEHFVAVHADPAGASFRFALGGPRQARLLFPSAGTLAVAHPAGDTELTLAGGEGLYFVGLEPSRDDTLSRDVQVRADRHVDPYEEVVKNQVFQESERDKFESLDVMEYLTQTPLSPGADQITWEHRIIQRAGHLTDYHHLGYRLNGAPVPQDRLLKGRIFRSEALVQLKPLDVELDETYQYRYLGDEVIGGRTTYKIAFEPLRQGTQEDGSFVSGIVWIDPLTHAHHRIRAVQKGLDGTLISQERTTDYGWIPSGDQCFWDWRARRGTHTTQWLGEQYSTRTETVRTDFRYNRPDIEEVVREAYASDVLIHVESPPEGHRWLVHDHGGRRLAGTQIDDRLIAAHSESHAIPGAGGGHQGSGDSGSSPGRGTEDATADYGDRVLADVHAFSTRARFSLFSVGEGGDFDLYPGIVLTDVDFLDRGYQAYLGLFLEDAVISLAKPQIFGKRWTLNARLFLPYEHDDRNGFFDLGDGVGPRDVSARIHQPSLSLSLGIPVGRRTTLGLAYLLTRSDFEATANTDPNYVLPQDTLEHGADLSLNHRWGRTSAEVGVEFGMREDWEPWGLFGGAALEDSYQVYRASLASSWLLGRSGGPRQQILTAALGLWKGNDLDAYSRLRNGRARAGLVGFDNDLGFDEGVFLSLSYGTRILGRAVNFRLDDGHTRIEDDGETVHRVGFRFRFLIHGPWRLDLWPSINVSLHSSIPEEEGDVTFGLFIQRRQ